MLLLHVQTSAGDEKRWRNSWLTLLLISHYNVNIQSGHMKILEHISACRLFLFWRAAGHLQSISRSGFIWSIACVHILYVMYVSVYVPIVKSCIMELHWGLWNRLQCHSRSVVTLFHWNWSYRALFYEINNDINTKALRCQSPSHPKQWLTGKNDSSIMALFSFCCSFQDFAVIYRRGSPCGLSLSLEGERDSHALSRL